MCLHGIMLLKDVCSEKIRNSLHVILLVILGVMYASYVLFDPFIGFFALWFNYLFIKYVYINNVGKFMIWNDKTDGLKLIVDGLILIFNAVFVMEFIGHWYLEGVSSNIVYFFNSVIHTPLYNFKNVIELINKY